MDQITRRPARYLWRPAWGAWLLGRCGLCSRCLGTLLDLQAPNEVFAQADSMALELVALIQLVGLALGWNEIVDTAYPPRVAAE
eukprot:1731612-Rhodomonas_salina.1